MKKAIILTTILLLAAVVPSVAQSFEGKIIVQSKVTDAPPEMQAMKSMVESTMTTWVKGNKSRMETSNPFTGELISITDYDKKESVTCMNLMGQKKAVVSPLGETAMSQPSSVPANFNYKDTGNTKIILGYTCHEALASYTGADGKPMSMSIWFTKELPNRNAQYPGLSGMPMEYSMHVQGMTLTMLTTAIEKLSVSDDKFNIPDGYVLTTQEEMQKGMSGMGGRK